MLSTDRVDLLKLPPIPSLTAADTRGARPPVLRATSARGGGQHTHLARENPASVSTSDLFCSREETITLMSRPPNPFTLASVLNKLACWQKDTLLSVLCVRRTMTCVALSSQRRCIQFPTDFLKCIRQIGAAGEGGIPTHSVPGVKIHKVPHLDDSTV